MPLALIIYIVFLAIEGGLAWLVSGNPFLLAAVTCGLLSYAAVWKSGGPWGEIVRAVAAGLIAVAGPLYYKASLLPTLLCFLALPHLLAATQCFWEMALGKDPTPQNMRMRTVVFTVAFYAAMGLVFVLLRGAEPLSVWMTAPLAVLVLILAIPAWDLARVTRLKPGQLGQKVPLTVKTRRVILVLMVLGALGAVFSGVLPAAAEKLCAVSPRWRLKADTPEDRPPHQEKKVREPQPNNSSAQRPGLDSSAAGGRHELPQQSDIQSSGETVLYLRPHSRTQAEQMARGEVYVRSYTLDDWKDGAWSPAVVGGRWVEDAADGATDGMVTLQNPSPAPIPHTVFLENADGYSLPALQNVSALGFPRVWAVPGDVHQLQATGNIRYDAVSSPLNWTTLPGREQAMAGNSGVPAQAKKPDSQVMMNLIYSNPRFDKDRLKTLARQVSAVDEWLTDQVHYSTVMKGDPNLTPLDNFLIGERKGYCDFYATAGALMLRFFDVPTRVAYGYAGKRFDEKGGVFIFTDESAHAWTEIFIEGQGWTVCDFTPGENIGNLGGENDSPKPPFDEKQFAQQKEPPPPEKSKEEKEAESAASLSDWWKETMTKLAELDPMERAKKTITWLAVAASLYFLTRLLWKRKKPGGEDGESAFTKDENQPAYFAEFIRVFQQAGCPRRPGSTPKEYLGTVRGRGFGGEEFLPMMEYHYARRYADAERDRQREQEWVELARAVEERLRQRPREN